MTKIFKQLARHWAVCLVVFALLFVQAYCDLALPDYTSKIVDTGIQQGGIESPLPQTVRQSTLDALSLLMNEEDAQKLQNAYQYYLQDDGVLQLRSDLTEDERTALEDAVTTPDIVLYMAAAQAANTPAGQNSMGMTGLAEMPSAAADTDTETVTPTAADLDTVCSQFAAMSQMPGFDRSMLQKQLDSAMSQLDSTLLENPVFAAGAAGIRGTGRCAGCADGLPLPGGRPDAGAHPADGGRGCGRGLPCLPGIRRHRS